MIRKLSIALLLSSAALAADTLPEEAADLKLMAGNPPPVEARVTRENFMAPPYNRWSLQHIRELQPTREIWRGTGPVSPLAEAMLDFGATPVALVDGRSVPFGQWLKEAYTDAVLVMHKGKVVYESYLNGQKPHTQHQMFSATKSWVGTLLLMLIEEGKVKRDALVTDYLPELKGSGFEGATVDQVLDMTTELAFREDYVDPTAEIHDYAQVFGLWATGERGGPANVHDFLKSMKAAGPHGQGFKYVTPNTDVCGWIVSRVMGKRLATIFEETFWQPMGFERDGYFWLDREANDFAGGGLNITLRDAARFGQMILDDGKWNGRQIIPATVAKKIKAPGDEAAHTAFTKRNPDEWYERIGWAYHDQWWVFNNAHRAVSAIGVHGQFIYIDPVADMVIVKQTSDPEAESMRNEVDGPLIYQQIAEKLMAGAVK